MAAALDVPEAAIEVITTRIAYLARCMEDLPCTTSIPAGSCSRYRARAQGYTSAAASGRTLFAGADMRPGV